jgi:hypothetical protein
MSSLPVYYEQRLVGIIEVGVDGPSFVYDPKWLSTRGAFPLSIMMSPSPRSKRCPLARMPCCRCSRTQSSIGPEPFGPDCLNSLRPNSPPRKHPSTPQKSRDLKLRSRKKSKPPQHQLGPGRSQHLHNEIGSRRQSWRHSQVSRCMADKLDRKAVPLAPPRHPVTFSRTKTIRGNCCHAARQR